MRKKVFFLGIVYVVSGIICIILGISVFKKTGKAEIKIKTKAAVMPVAYKVYGNPEVADGRYYLVKLSVTDKGEGIIKNFSVSYRVPDYIEWTTPKTYKEILPGQTVVDLFYPQFPSRILDVLNETTAQIEIKISYNNGKETKNEIKRCNFQIRGRNEILYTDMPEEEITDIRDLFTNVNLVSCFVTPEDPIIKYFTQRLQKDVLKGTVAGVSNSQEEILRFMKALYDFEIKAGLVYGGTLGLPEKVGDHYTMVQHIRLPREVITGGAGLCIELATLFCSVAQSAGLNCGIFVTSRHAFPAIIAGGNIIPIEATGIGGEGIGGRMDFKKAVQLGMKEAQAFFAGGNSDIGAAIAFLNIGKLQGEGIRPPDLKDNPDLKKKIDKLFKKETTTKTKKFPSRTINNNASIHTATQNFRSYTDPAGYFSFSYPSYWQLAYSPNPYLPSLKIMAASPNMTQDIEVYVFPGTYDTNAAFTHIYNTLISLGTQIQFQPAGNVSIGGKTYTRFAGMSISGYQTIYWAAYFTRTSKGVIGFVIGSTSNRLDTPELITVKNSFRVIK